MLKITDYISVVETVLLLKASYNESPVMHYGDEYCQQQVIGANVVRAHARFPCEGRRSGH